FSKIASFTPKEDKNYTYVDEQFNGQSTYYRLNQTDIDGTSSYSQVIYLKYNKGANLSVFPNPATDEINISIPKTGQVSTLKIVSAEGKHMYESRLNPTDTQTTINIQELPVGNYIVLLEL